MRIAWYFDFISPFAYLHWQKVKPLMRERPVEPLPILFAAILNAHGQKGPAEIPGKREFTYRHVLWQARREGVPLRAPPAHPFNPIPALRLCIAAGATPEAIDAIYDWIWGQGRAGDSVEALQPLLDRLGVAAEALGSDAVKQALRANTDAALAAGVFGVPTLAIGEALFWGNDVHEFALQALADPGLLEDPEMRRVDSLPVGIRRI
jgi:2-hydroxychromene-2-carboxylate isomerase